MIDDKEIISTDLQRVYVVDMIKSNNRVNFLNLQWACSPSLQIYARNVRTPPSWSCSPPRLLMMRRQSVLICKELIMEIWKKLTIASIPWIYSEHAHLLCSFTPEMCKYPLFEVICLCDYWWYKDSPHWFAKSVCWKCEKNNNRVNPLNIQWACSPSLQLYARNVLIPLVEVVCLRDYCWCRDSRCWFAKS
jgi:hypothetical protein